MCFKVPFLLLNFDGAILMKVSIDKGGGSVKSMLNIVNVSKPQSLTHLKLLGLFDGVKESYGNFDRTFKNSLLIDWNHS